MNSRKAFPGKTVLSALAAVATAALPVVKSQAQSSPVIGVLRLSSLDNIASAAGAFANNVQPGSGAAAGQLPMMARQEGVDTTGEILALLINPNQSSQPYGLVFPVADPDAVSKALSFQPATKPDIFKATLPGLAQVMFASFEGKKLILAPMEANIELLKPLIKGDAIASSLQPLRSGGGQIALSVSLEQLYMAYKPMIDMGLMAMRSQAQKAPSGAAAGTNPAAAFGMVESMAGMLGEVKGIGLRLSIEPEYLNLSAVLQARPGTGLATFLNLGKGPSTPTLSAFSPDSAMLGTFSMKPSQEFFKAYNDFLTAIFNASGDPGAKKASDALVSFMNDFAAAWDGTGSFAGFAPGQKGMAISGIYGITDAAKAIEMVRKMPALQGAMGAFSSGSGLETTATIEGESKEGGTTFIDVNLNYKATSPAGQEGLQGMKRMGMGEKIPTTYAVTSNQMVYTMGEGSRETAKKVLSGAAGGASVSPREYGFADNPNFFMAMSIPRLMQWAAASGSIPNAPKASAPAGKPGLAMTLNGNGNGEFQLFLSAKELASLIKMGEASGRPASGGAGE